MLALLGLITAIWITIFGIIGEAHDVGGWLVFKLQLLVLGILLGFVSAATILGWQQ